MLSVQWLKLEEENRIRCCDEKNWVLTQNIVEKKIILFPYNHYSIFFLFWSKIQYFVPKKDV